MIGIDWREFVPLVRLSTAACPVSAIIAQLRDAAREFCTDSRAWTNVSEPTDILEGAAIYGVHPPVHTDVCAVLSVRVCGRRIAPLSPEQWRRLGAQAAKDPTHFTVTEPSLVRLYPEPSEALLAALVVEVALLPSARSALCPQFLLTKHGTTIAKGAQARLMLMPDRPWTDANTGAFLRTEFKDAVAAAKIEVERGGADAPSRVKYRPFGL